MKDDVLKQSEAEELTDEELEKASGGIWFEMQTPSGEKIYTSDSRTPFSAPPEKPSRCPRCSSGDIAAEQVTDSRLIPKGRPTKAYHYVCHGCGYAFD